MGPGPGLLTHSTGNVAVPGSEEKAASQLGHILLVSIISLSYMLIITNALRDCEYKPNVSLCLYSRITVGSTWDAGI